MEVDPDEDDDDDLTIISVPTECIGFVTGTTPPSFVRVGQPLSGADVAQTRRACEAAATRRSHASKAGMRHAHGRLSRARARA